MLKLFNKLKTIYLKFKNWIFAIAFQIATVLDIYLIYIFHTNKTIFAILVAVQVLNTFIAIYWNYNRVQRKNEHKTNTLQNNMKLIDNFVKKNLNFSIKKHNIKTIIYYFDRPVLETFNHLTFQPRKGTKLGIKINTISDAMQYLKRLK